MNASIRTAGLGLALILAGLAGPVSAEEKELPAATNPLERMHLKNAKCAWTQEIGEHIYQCLKANFGMNAHWCHNEAMEVLCPKQLGSATAQPAPAEAAK